MTTVVHLTTVHPPDDSRIFHKECRTLAAAGYEVILVASEKEGPKGLGIGFRVLPPTRSRGTRIMISTARALKVALSLRADMYHFHDPELLPVGVALRALGKRVIYDAHEDLPRQILSKPWVSPALRGPLGRVVALVEWAASRMLSGVVAATPTIAERFPVGRTACVQNFPMTDEFSTVEPVPYHDRPADIAYVGRVDRVRGSHEMVLAMRQLDRHPEARLLIAGKIFDPALEAELQVGSTAGRIQCVGWLNRSEIASLLARVRVGLVLLHPTPAYLDSYPIKLFEYMAAGVPVIASDFPLWRSIVEGARCGLLVNPMDPSAIARAIARLLDHPEEAAAMGERGRQAVFTHYSWQSQAAKLLALYARLIGESAAADERAAAVAIPSSTA